ncbi:MAG: DUF983 domain-containing protein [Flavobacteriaceae bacterium]|nr:DUF983 domain-containing protein [Flavobacteriaceae bacterium]
MIKKGTKLFSIKKGRCPYCHEGAFFVSHSYNFKKIGDIHNDCQVCNNTFHPEPGFYFGSMYISYALGTAYFVSILVAFYLLKIEIEFLSKIIIISVGWLFLSPKMYSLSKIIWANIFMHYKSNNNLNK